MYFSASWNSFVSQSSHRFTQGRWLFQYSKLLSDIHWCLWLDYVGCHICIMYLYCIYRNLFNIFLCCPQQLLIRIRTCKLQEKYKMSLMVPYKILCFQACDYTIDFVLGRRDLSFCSMLSFPRKLNLSWWKGNQRSKLTLKLYSIFPKSLFITSFSDVWAVNQSFTSQSGVPFFWEGDRGS
jgi:hypothetical protein